MGNEELRNQWHPPFYAAMWLELRENRDDLQYESEYNLSTMPLRIDLLIIWKNDEVKVKRKIGHLFRKYNLLEYKSPEDKIGIDTYFKVYGYACLFRALPNATGKVNENDITITFVRESYPRKLMTYFSECGFEIIPVYAGIYYVRKEGHFPMQIIVTRQLEKQEYIWLTALTRNMKKGHVDLLAEELKKLVDPLEVRMAHSVVDLTMSVNEKMFEKMKKGDPMKYEGFMKIFREEIEAKVLEAEIKKEKDVKVDAIDRFMAACKMPLEAACTVMGITERDYKEIKQNMAAKQIA